MTLSRLWLGLLLLAFSTTAFAQGKKDAHVFYKDGFTVKGKVEEKSNIIYDAASGRPFVLPTGNFHIDDYVRRIYFSPANVGKVFQFKPGEIKEPIKVVRFDRVFQNLKIGASFRFGKIPHWDETAERTISIKNTATGRDFEMQQRLGIISSQYVTAATTDYEWNLVYFTSEFSPDVTRKILVKWLNEMKAYQKWTDQEKYLLIANFMHEAGWHKEAEAELTRIIAVFATDKRTVETAKEVLAKLKAQRANLFADNIEKRAKVGQHQEALDLLDAYDDQKLAALVSADFRIKINDLKAKYDKDKTDIKLAKEYLKEFAGILNRSPVWPAAAEFIAAELNYDTIGKLEDFIPFAQQYLADVRANKKPAQKPEEVLAIAVSGWLQGARAAIPDVANAIKLVHARALVLEVLRTDNQVRRTALINGFKYDDLPVDVFARLITMLPPSHPHDQLGNNIQTVKIDLPDSDGGSYLLQLPPDYQPMRSYPVVVLLHSARYAPEEMLKQFTAEAAAKGFVLAAPLWAGAKGKNATYKFTDAEHALVLDTIRDLRRRVQVDSDRVCLFGWEDGGTYAFDVALGHPDQFAAVVPINGPLAPFTRRFYWPNAQYLPFYVVEGDRNVVNAKAMAELYKEWTRSPYTCFYVEYKGRGSEWYTPEIERSLDWMSRKTRYHPKKEMGRANLGSGLGEEFHSSRPGDNRFYWLRCDTIDDRNQFPHSVGANFKANFRPATFQGNLSVGNEKDAKGARIWNQANLRVSGTKQFSFWISPTMGMDLAHPLQLVINGQKVGGLRMIQPSLETMLEELYQTGDRQRLFVAKVDIKM